MSVSHLNDLSEIPISDLYHMQFSLTMGLVSQVCDRELFPVSMFKMDIDESQQTDLQENDKIELLQGGEDSER